MYGPLGVGVGVKVGDGVKVLVGVGVGVVVVVLLGALAPVAWGQPGSPVQVLTAPVAELALPEVMPVVGTIEPMRRSVVAAEGCIRRRQRRARQKRVCPRDRWP